MVGVAAAGGIDPTLAWPVTAGRQAVTRAALARGTRGGTVRSGTATAAEVGNGTSCDGHGSLVGDRRGVRGAAGRGRLGSRPGRTPARPARGGREPADGRPRRLGARRRRRSGRSGRARGGARRGRRAAARPARQQRRARALHAVRRAAGGAGAGARAAQRPRARAAHPGRDRRHGRAGRGRRHLGRVAARVQRRLGAGTTCRSARSTRRASRSWSRSRRSWRASCATRGVRVQVVCPGLVRSEFHSRQGRRHEQRAAHGAGLGRRARA